MADPTRPVGLIGAPSARATRGYRLVVGTADTIGRGIFGFRVEVRGRSRLPRDASDRPVGGWIAAGLPHRTWVDPFVVASVLPVEPRLVFFGDGRAIFRSAWRRWLVRRIGGVIPIWPGGDRAAIEAHLAAADQALRAGAVLCLFPETGPATPPGTARPFGAGLAYFALRTGAPIVPIVLGGTHELYRGRRFRLEVLDPVTWQELAGVAPETAAPKPWSSAERRVAHGDEGAPRADDRRRRSRASRHGGRARHAQTLDVADDRLGLIGRPSIPDAWAARYPQARCSTPSPSSTWSAGPRSSGSRD